MNKRAEEAVLRPYHKALEYYPLIEVNEPKQITFKREGFIKGYEQAEKDTIERAVNVLINLPSLVIPSNYIAYFRKKMMEEDNG